MAKKRFSPEQVVAKLRQVEVLTGTIFAQQYTPPLYSCLDLYTFRPAHAPAA